MRRSAGRLVVLAAACTIASSSCGGGTKFIPPGSYSGSDAAHRRFTLDLTRGGVRVNQAKARFIGPGRIRAGELELRCEPRAEGEEVHCRVRFPDHTETIDLMRL